MRVVVRGRGGAGQPDALASDVGEVEVAVSSDATAADLAVALFGTAGGVVVDGVALAAGERLVGRLCHGSTVAWGGVPACSSEGSPHDSAGPAGAGGPADVAVVALRVVGGLSAGGAIPLAPGRHLVGRDQLGHPTVGAPHVAVEVDPAGAVTVADLGSTNGTMLDGVPLERATGLRPGSVLQCGAVLVGVGPVPPDPLPLPGPGPDGRRPFHRPPPRRIPPPPAVVRLPAPAPEPTPAARLGMAGVLVPAAAGLVMALVVDWRFAVLALLSPLVMAGTWLEERRRAGRHRRASRMAQHAALARLRRALAEAAACERARRQALMPDPAEVVAHAFGPTAAVWARRPGGEGFGAVRLGTGDVWWDAPVEEPPGGPSFEVASAVREASLLAAVPVGVTLAPGRVLGIAGHRAAAVALARSVMCQLAVQAGPADLALAVAAAPGREAEWSWANWLPHMVPTEQVRRSNGGLGVVVVDGDHLSWGPGAPLRWVLAPGAPVAAVVLADSPAALPAACTTVVHFDGAGGPDGACSVEHAGGEAHGGVLVAGMAIEPARRCARALARLADPEAGAGAAGLPTEVGLLALLGLPVDEASLAAALAERWEAAAATAGLTVPLGVGESGPVVVDLVADGPHGLVAGTTGSGKSELLRALVAALAADRSPDDCAFVLIDYKGGAAFDACARLPHVAGVVTDLDAGLAARALRGLEAELRARERRLRRAGAADLASFRRAGGDGAGPLLSLVVVVDEFAALQAELPDFVDALVDLARRGRSLGIHLVLATQRPGGVVSDAIRANCSLRVALRVQEPAESTDIVEVATAATFPPGVAGRAVLRRAPGETVVFQGAHTGVRTPEPSRVPPVVVRAAGPAACGPAATRPAAGGPAAGGGSSAGAATPTDLERLAAAAAAVASRLGLAPPAPPWLAPLPDRLTIEALPEAEGPGGEPAACIGIADDPDGRRQPPWQWDPSAGNLLCLGSTGSGAEDALVTLVVQLARNHPPGRVHVQAADAGPGRLAPLAGLPHVGSVVGAADRERQERLVRRLLGEVEDRKASGAWDRPGGPPLVVLVVANLGGLLASLDDPDGDWARNALVRIAADGPAVGVVVAASADRPAAVPAALASAMGVRLAFRLADPHDAVIVGLPVRQGRLPAGRAVDAATGWEVQVAAAGEEEIAAAVAAVAGRWSGVQGGPEPVGVLPPAVTLAETFTMAGERAGGPGGPVPPGVLVVPLGVSGRDLGPALLPLGPGDHVLVAGPPRSGRSTTLATIAAALRRCRPDLAVTVVAPVPSPLRELESAERIVADEGALDDLAAALAAAPGPQLVLLDDADFLDDECGALAGLTRRLDLHVVAAGRPDALRPLYGHVTAEVRRSRVGVLLQPAEGDGDLLGVPVLRPGRGPFLPGRGVLVAGGVVEVVQVATPWSAS